MLDKVPDETLHPYRLRHASASDLFALAVSALMLARELGPWGAGDENSGEARSGVDAEVRTRWWRLVHGVAGMVGMMVLGLETWCVGTTSGELRTWEIVLALCESTATPLCLARLGILSS